MPSGWNELSPEQLLLLAQWLVDYSKQEPAIAAQIKTEVAQNISGFKKEAFENKDAEFFISEVLNKLLPEVEFLFTGNTLTKNLFPIIRIRKYFIMWRLHGPKDNFENLTFSEFEDAEFWLEQFQQLKEDKEKDHALNMLCSVLYREYGDNKGDERIPYDALDNELRAKKFEHCDWKQKLCILLFYIGCRNSLVADFKILFEGKTEGRSDLTWADFAHSLAGPVLGDIDKVSKRMVRQVFYEMRRLKLEAIAIEEKQKENQAE